MFCAFTTKHGTLVVRTQDIRWIEDQPRGDAVECVVVWVDDQGCPERRTISGTAAENLARLIAEDQARSAAYAHMQQRQGQGLPFPSVPRGKAGR